MEEYNDDGRIEVVGTSKNVECMHRQGPPGWPELTPDVALCVRNILVQRLLFGSEDFDHLAHSPQTISIARLIAQEQRLLPSAVKHIQELYRKSKEPIEPLRGRYRATPRH